MSSSRRTLLPAAFLTLAIVVAACGGGSETADSTTAAPATTTTAPATTTAAPTTTSTAAPTTTTTAAPTTTTAAPPSEPAVVATEYGTLGWYDHASGEWVTSPMPDALPPGVDGSEFEVVALDGSTSTSTGEVDACEITGSAMIDFSPPLPGEQRVSGSVAVAGAVWELVPRPVTPGEVPQERLDVALDHLAAQGIEEVDPPFTQYAEADLDGDGTAEGILVVGRGEALAGPGDFSLALLFSGDDASVISESYGEATSPYLENLVLAAVADLDGDGTMEAVFDLDYYEGSASLAFQLADGAMVNVLGGGCGA